MAQLAIAAAGAAIGSVIAPGIGTSIGWALGSMVGAQFGPKQKSYGPRLEDLRVTGSEYGQTIPWVAGHPRVAGQVWWASNRREISTTTSAGKGGGGAESTSYTYEVDILYGLCNKVIAGVTRIWCNGKLVWTLRSDSSDDSVSSSEQTDLWKSIAVYTGEATQLPDPTYDAAVTNAPAYRGRATVMIQGLQLGTSGVIPNLTFEITDTPSDDPTVPYYIKDLAITGNQRIVYFDADNETFQTAEDSGVTFNAGICTGSVTFRTYSYSTGALLSTTVGSASIPVAGVTQSSSFFKAIFVRGKQSVAGVSRTAAGSSPAATTISGVGTFDRGDAGTTNTTDKYYTYADGRYWFPSSSSLRDHLGNVYTISGASHQGVAVQEDAVTGRRFVRYFNGSNPTLDYIAEFTTDPSSPLWTFQLPTGSMATNQTGFYARDGIIAIDKRLNNGAHRFVFVYKVESAGLTLLGSLDIGASGAASADIIQPRYAWSDGKVYRVDGPRLFTLDPPSIEEVVDALCVEAGMPTGSYDASALASITKPVRAFVLSQVATTRSALEQLASAYFFESYATDKLYFVPRAGSPVGSVDADDLGTGIDAPADDALPTDVGSDMEIPAQVSLSYANVDADYTTATELSDRLLSGQVSTSTTQIPLAFTAAEAKGIADAIVMDGYASRVTGSFAVPMKYAALVPTDVVTVQDPDGNTYRVRIVRRTDSGPLLSFEWALDDATVVESAGITSSDYTPTVDVALPGETLMELLDIPLLRDDENKLGHYVAASSPATTWPGASISRSSDDVEFVEAARVNERAIFGTATTALGNWTGGKVFDETNTVTVSLSYGTLSSSTRSAMLDDAGINLMLIGQEVIRFRTATFVSIGVYTLSGLLRGQLGTEWAMGGHTASDRVVLLRAAGLRYVAIDLPSLAAARYYKGVTIGKSLASVDSEAFTCAGVSLKPLAPVNLRRTVGTGNQITLTWSRRTRLACTFTGAAGISVPLGEGVEAYEVDVVLIAGSVLKRTISAGSASAVYTAAMQTADGISGSTPIRFDVYQMSAVVGRGYAGSLTTTGSVTPLPQITTLTVGGSFATGAALFATLGGVTYNHTSVGGDTNLDGIAAALAAVIDAAPAYAATAVGSVVTVTGPVSAAFPVVAGVSAGDNTATWALTQTASATVAGVSNQITMRWLNLGDPAGSNAYPLGMTMYALVQRISPPLNLTYSYVTTPSGRTNYEVLPIAAAAIQSAFNASGDAAAYGLSMTLSDPGVSQLSLFTPAAEPYNWTVQAISSVSAVSGLVGDIGSGVTPATLRPQIVTLTLAGTPVTGRVYRATLGGVPLDYTATGGDTTMSHIATGLAGVIDAHSDYLASAAGDVITITHASDNVPFTYSATIVASTVTLTAATTQEAA